MSVHARLDIPLESPLDDRPESAEARLWFERDLVLTNAEHFSWGTFRSAEGATPKAAAMMAKRGMTYDEDVVFAPTKTGGLSTSARRGEPTLVVNEERDGPIVPDSLMSFAFCARPRDRGANWPIRILGFHRDLTGRHWRVMSLVGRYAGRKGPPTGLSHAHEMTLPDFIGRSFSIWTADDGRFVGLGTNGKHLSQRRMRRRRAPSSRRDARRHSHYLQTCLEMIVSREW